MQDRDRDSVSPDTFIQHVRRGYYNKAGVRDWQDDMGGALILLLQENGQVEEAAALALQTVLNVREDAVHAAYWLARCGAQSPALKDKYGNPQDRQQTRLIANLILLQAARHPPLRKLRCHPPPGYNASHYLQAARDISPNPPLIDLIQGQYLANQYKWQQALPLLERAAAECPEHLNGSAMYQLWACRFFVLNNARAALQCPWQQAHAACWNYQVARQLMQPDFLRRPYWLHQGDKLPDLMNEALIPHYLQLASRRTDHFWQGWLCGEQGLHFADCMPPDAYSELCLQLANLYKKQQRFEDARSLHQQGIATLDRKTFKSHAKGLCACAQALGEAGHAERMQRRMREIQHPDFCFP